MFPIGDDNSDRTITPYVNYIFIAINVLVFVFLQGLGGNESFSYAYSLVPKEITDGIADYSEIFTVTKDLPSSDPRVQSRWPCHGPCPWPDQKMKQVISRYIADLGTAGQKLLALIELGLDVPTGSLTQYTNDGWHHMRVLR